MFRFWCEGHLADIHCRPIGTHLSVDEVYRTEAIVCRVLCWQFAARLVSKDDVDAVLATVDALPTVIKIRSLLREKFPNKMQRMKQILVVCMQWVLS